METSDSVICCSNIDLNSKQNCKICNTQICNNCRFIVNNQELCGKCMEQLRNELEEEKAGNKNLVGGIIGGAAGAILGGIVWALVVVLTNYEIGYVAVAIGWLTGKGVSICSKYKKSKKLQIISAAWCVVGLIIGKYFIFAHSLKEYLFKEQNVNLSYFNPGLFQIIISNLNELLSPWDLLWLFIALGVAWNMPRPTELK